jgi:hypothetical protein
MTINVNDLADRTARTPALGTYYGQDGSIWGYISGLAPARINFKYAGTDGVTINGVNVWPGPSIQGGD